MRQTIRTSSVLLVLALAGCGTGAVPASTATPDATTSPGASAAAAATTATLDPCLVGTWTVVGQSQNSPANDESISYSGGEGEVYTIDAQGRVTIDTHAARTIVFVSGGEKFTAVVAGTGHGTVSTISGGNTRFFHFEPSPADTRTTHSFGPDGAELGPARPDTAFTAVYTCAPGRFTFYKSAVNYMVDGPIEELVAGDKSSSMPTAAPS